VYVCLQAACRPCYCSLSSRLAQSLRSDCLDIQSESSGNDLWLLLPVFRCVPMRLPFLCHRTPLVVPNLAWGYPAQLGGRCAAALHALSCSCMANLMLAPTCSVLPLRIGDHSRLFIKQLQEDCPSCKWWDDFRPLPADAHARFQVCGSHARMQELAPGLVIVIRLRTQACCCWLLCCRHVW
jgi:hypothetical protein